MIHETMGQKRWIHAEIYKYARRLVERSLAVAESHRKTFIFSGRGVIKNFVGPEDVAQALVELKRENEIGRSH